MRSAGLLAALVLAACADGGETRPPLSAPAPRAAFVLEPPRVGVGQPSVLELAVVTPPGHALEPYAPPAAVAGFSIERVEPLPVVEQPERWLHRTRLHLRARGVGRFEWPAASVTLRAPDGSRQVLAVPAHPLEVVSILPELPDRVTPFGPRRLPAEGGVARGALAGAVAGALAALAVVGLAGLARRRRALRDDRAPEALAAAEPLWAAARAQLEAARAAAADDAPAAAGATAATLRRYAAQRFGADVVSRTTEELAAARPPFALTTRWRSLVEILGELDALRFRAPPPLPGHAALRARVEELVARAEAFVDDTIPPGARP